MKVVKVTSKGQVTIPVEVRVAMGIDEDTYLEVLEIDNEIRLKKVIPSPPLNNDDPIWDLIGAGESRLTDVAENHDRYIAERELERWRESS